MLQNSTMWLRDTGILGKLQYDEMKPPLIKPDPIARVNQPLTIQQMAITLIVLLAGQVFSVLVFLVEVLKRKRKRSPPSKDMDRLKERDAPNDVNYKMALMDGQRIGNRPELSTIAE